MSVIRTLSMGAGVQTTALIIMNPKRYDYVIFADTGDEKQETYYYIEKHLKPFCKEKGVEWVTVKHKHGFSLMEWCMKRKIIPIRTRRWCTMDFKVKPINRFLRTIGATKKNPVHVDIGFSVDEAHRINFNKYDVQYVVKEYPLLDQNITRNQCYKIITDAGFPIPPKSGCDFCMFQKRSELRKMLVTPQGRARLEEINKMEKNDRYYPRKPLIGKYPIDGLLHNNTLDAFTDDSDEIDSCDTGHCFH